MSFLGIKVPYHVGKLLSQIKVPGEKSDIQELHITLLYLGKNTSLSEIYKCIETVHEIVSETKPFSVETKRISHFPGWEDNDKCAVIAKVHSKDLHDFQAKLSKAFDKYKIDFSKTFKEYKPHITLSYSKEEPEDSTIEPLSFMVSEIFLWCGEEMDDKIIIKFPFNKLEKNKHSQLLHKSHFFYKLAKDRLPMTKERALHTLKVSPQFTEKELKSAMRKLVLEHHPDRGGDPELLQDAIEAYKLLHENKKEIPLVINTPEPNTVVDPIPMPTTKNPGHPWGSWYNKR